MIATYLVLHILQVNLWDYIAFKKRQQKLQGEGGEFLNYDNVLLLCYCLDWMWLYGAEICELCFAS